MTTGFFAMAAEARAMDNRFDALQGKTLKSVTVNDTKDRIRFETDDGRVFEQFHVQDCCEDVVVESIVGDLSDLIGTPILLAEEAESGTPPADAKQEYVPESQTWTFYKLRTIKGSVDIRWLGVSNGYYSESVEFAEVRA